MTEQKLYRILQVSFTATALACVVIAGLLYANGTTMFKARRAAWDLVGDHDYEAGVNALEEYLERRPRSSFCWTNLAIARFHTGDYEGAAAALRESWTLRGHVDVPHAAPYLIYLRALANDELPAGMLPSLFGIHAPGDPPEEYREARGDLQPGTYAKAAAGFEACLGRMPGTPGEVDALWGLAIARFFMDDYSGALEAIERIRAGSDRPPSKEFDAVVDYIEAVAEGRAPAEPMPRVLRDHAPHEEE